MNVTILDIAREANVSKTVVSDILRGSGTSRFHEDTKQRVLETADALGYSPNRAARSLVTGRTHLIALWMPHLLSAYYARIAHTIQSGLRQTPYDLIIAQTGQTPSSQVDGILALVDSHAAVEASVRAHRNLISRAGLPALCLMGCNMDSYVADGADSVSVDLASATRDAVHHLLENGCRRVAFLTGESIIQGEARSVAFAEAMNAAGHAPEYIAIPDTVPEPRAAARAAVREYAERGRLPDGIICLNDELAIGAHRALRESGLRVPEDVALIGCDGIEDTEYVEPTLSTLVQPIEAMCLRSWELLQRRIESAECPTVAETMKAKLIVRASSHRLQPAK